MLELAEASGIEYGRSRGRVWPSMEQLQRGLRERLEAEGPAAAIEAEAVAQRNAELAAKVRELPAPVSQYSWDDPPSQYSWDDPPALLHDYLTRSAVIALIEAES